MNAKKAIVQYLGQQFGGDVRVTLESGEMFVFLAPKKPADDEVDDNDAAGNVTKTARQKVSYVKNKPLKKRLLSMSRGNRSCQQTLKKHSLLY